MTFTQYYNRSLEHNLVVSLEVPGTGVVLREMVAQIQEHCNDNGISFPAVPDSFQSHNDDSGDGPMDPATVEWSIVKVRRNNDLNSYVVISHPWVEHDYNVAQFASLTRSLKHPVEPRGLFIMIGQSLF